MKEKQKEDLRISRTKKLLSRSLFNLLEKKPFEKINVTDICNNAMINRVTFYNHFESKEHLLECALDELKNELFASATQRENFFSIKDMSMSLLNKVLSFAEENRNKILLIFKQNIFQKTTDIFISATKKSVDHLLSQNDYNISYVVPKDILIDFFIGGITNIGLNWLMSPTPRSKSELYKYLDILLDEKMYIKEKK